MKNFTLFIFTFLSVGLFAQNSKIYPKGKIALGEENTFIYEPGKNIAIPENVSAKYVSTISYKTSALIKKNNNYEFIVKVPDSIRTVIVSVFDNNGNLFDNNSDKGYVLILNNKNPSKTNFDKLLLLQNQASYFFKLKYSSQFFVNGYKNLFKTEPSLKENPQNISIYLSSLATVNDKKAEEEGKVFVKNLEQKKDEKSLVGAESIIRYVLKDSKRADSLSSSIIEKYPYGKLAKNKLVSKFFKEANDTKTPPDQNILMQYVSDFKNKYPKDIYDAQISDQMNAVILNKIVADENWSKIEDFTNNFNDKIYAAPIFNVNAWKLADGDNLSSEGKDLDFAEKLAQKSLEILNYKINNLGEYDQKLNYDDSLMFYTDALALVYYKEKKYQQAFNEQSKIIDLSNIDDTNRERYVLYASKVKDNNFIKNYIYNLLKNQNISKNLFATLSNIYKSENLNSQEIVKLNEENKKIETNRYRKNLLDLYSGNLKAKDFELTNLEDKKVKLSDLKGKIVVLDFWATWCGPCRAALPHMQNLVKKYDKSEVAFLFVNTMENEKPDVTKNKVSKFIADNKYDLNVLYDLDNNVRKNYLVQGIPCEIVIDKEGNLIARSEGYDSNLEALINENK